MTLANLYDEGARGDHRDTAPARPGSAQMRPTCPERHAVMMEGKGDLLPVSAFPVDGTWPTGTTQWEKRNIALEIPIWDPEFCIQCNKCTMVCPHAAIRAKVYEPSDARRRSGNLPVPADSRATEFDGMSYTMQVAPEDCTGCNLCVNVCPAKDKNNPRHKAINMEPHAATTSSPSGELLVLPRSSGARPHAVCRAST